MSNFYKVFGNIIPENMKLLKNKSNKTQLSHSQYEFVKNTMSKYFGPYSGYAQQFLYYRDS